nr:MAG TPA: hypothetical protein [Caudoviricetes sp.]
MAICLINKSGGGITSDDVTASKAQVLQGYRTITSDSDDEPVQGTMVNRGYHGPDTSEMWYYSQESGYVIRIEEGYYHKEAQGQWKPYILASPSLVKNAVNYHPEKTLSDTKTCEEQGQIKMINTQDNDYNINKSTAFGIDHIGRFWIDFPHGNGYYFRGDNHPHTCIDASNFGTAGADSVLSGQTATSQHGVKFEGAIPRWICTTAGVITALNGEGFVWDDSSGANRGRGIVARIPDKHFIQDASYVFLGSPNLYPQNVRQGVNINGVVGTMPDYSTGRVVFNGATFDGLLASGVAAKNFYFNRELYSYQIASGYGYSGVYGGGMNLSLRTTSPELRGRKIGCILSQSNNLTPFRRIVVDYRTTGSISGNPTINFYAFIAPSRALVREGVEFNGARVDGFSQMSVQVMASARQGQLVIDTSNINEQAFLGFYASANANGSENFNGAVQITKIEFFN